VSSFDVGTAFVRVLPDARQFQALLQAQVTSAVKAVSATTNLTAQTQVAGAATGKLAEASALAKTEAIQLAIAEAKVATENAAVAETAGAAAVATGGQARAFGVASAARLARRRCRYTGGGCFDGRVAGAATFETGLAGLPG